MSIGDLRKLRTCLQGCDRASEAVLQPPNPIIAAAFSTVMSGFVPLRVLFYWVPPDIEAARHFLEDQASQASSTLPILFTISARNPGGGTGFISKSKL
jgi:hypothetical protein